MKRIKRFINSRALVRLHMIRIGIGRRFHSKQRVSRWYNQPIANLILNLVGLLLLILTVCISILNYCESQKSSSTTIAQLDTLKMELARKPRLKLQVKECAKDSLNRFRITPLVMNLGDDIATNCKILLKVPAEFRFESSGYTLWDTATSTQAWGCEYPISIPYGRKESFAPIVFHPMTIFTIRPPPNTESPYKFYYALFHNKGFDEDTLVIDLSKCK